MNSNREREKALYLYSAALDRGDFDTVSQILAEAETDPELMRRLNDMNDQFALAQSATKDQASKSSQRAPGLRLSPVVAVVTILLVLVCGFGLVSTLSLGGMAAPQPMMEVTPNSLQGGAGSGGGGPQVGQSPLATPMALPTGTPGLVFGPYLQLSPTPAGTFSPGTQSQGGQLPEDRMIIRNGELDLIVEHTDTTIDQVSQIAADNGGYVLSTQADTINGVKNATITIAVQAGQFDTAMRRIRQIALEVRREISTGQDVTGEFVDLESRLRNLEATADRIRELLGQAASVQEALVINQQLSDVEAQIEQVKGRMNFLGGRSAYSTITIRIDQKFDATATPTPTLTPTPTATFTPTPTPVWSLGPTFERAAETQTGIVRTMLEFMTWVLVVFGPYIVMGALGLAAWQWLRKRTRP